MGLRPSTGLTRRVLAACGLLALSGMLPALATDDQVSTPDPSRVHITARPPLQVIPATPAGAGLVQQRMRQCNEQADAHKLRDGSRETFVRGCMAAHHPARKASSNAASEPQDRP
jgi:hypothetical protein